LIAWEINFFSSNYHKWLCSSNFLVSIVFSINWQWPESLKHKIKKKE